MTRRVLIFIGALVVLVTFTPFVPWWAHRMARSFDNPRGSVLIVLGAASSQNGILSYSTYLRAEYAVRAYREGWVQGIVLSGAATPMRGFMVANGVPPSIIIRVDDQSMSTHESAVNLASILKGLPGTNVLLTSDYHIFRATRAFQRAGLDVVPRALPDAYKRAASWSGRWPAFVDLVTESVKVGYYAARRWT